MAARRDPRIAMLKAVAHEVGNLLAAVRLSAHLLPHAPEARERARGARQIEQLAAQAGEILAQLRPLLARSGGTPGAIPTAEVLEGVRRGLADGPSAGRFEVLPAPRGMPDLRADADVLLHVLLTLVRGALEASPGGKVTLRVRRSDRHAVFEITDSGRPLEATPRGALPCGRALAVALARAALQRDGGSVEASPRRPGTRVRVRVRTAARRGHARPGRAAG
jgi:C4-dicarboxylate-specific signal transduction histidine kinase